MAQSLGIQYMQLIDRVKEIAQFTWMTQPGVKDLHDGYRRLDCTGGARGDARG